ncbi:CRISPR-associated protein Cse4 [Pokkaliibacter plantistimulans]|uniref:CRISPR-associated protein Cse4 n=1 Tax=Pokkaliibacter plantistimulans TaxID=1635171 RepID=A0ABX5LZE7_9GAMM|nr:type I-E CRISPR-associated protein Cas7/Cse4/CasC [Pokkaliibacter plantistimulans]PXF30798.1 CRISPR-associated protein Cse4 [Pokkaliibacter plantistimulans]
MNRFIQIHLLTSYPPANLNRDDQGRPKTAKMGGVDRLRVSSQSLKRHWRTSELFQHALAGHLGVRTKMLGTEAYNQLLAGGIKEKDALEWAKSIAGVFGKNKKADKKEPLNELEIEQLVHVSPQEQALIDQLVQTLIEQKRAPEEGELNLLRETNAAVDIALFGRMLASKPAFNVEAACQVAHALSVHPVVIEDDYFTAVDDLNDGREDAGSSHIGETGFAAGLFYSYLCINREQLIDNLAGDAALADTAIAALIEAAVKVPPSGKQNSFAHQGYASYVLAEVGNQQPRSLSVAYLKPIEVWGKVDADYLTQAVAAIRRQYQGFDQAYGQCAEHRYELVVGDEKSSFAELLAFVADASH